MKKIIVFCFLFLVSLDFVSAVVINQVLFDPIKSENSGEAIELYNENDSEVDISGWYISTERAEKDILLNNFILESRSYFLITDKNWSNLKDNLAWRNGDIEQVMTLNNKDSGIILKDKNGNVVDSVEWTKFKEGNSLLRVNFTGNLIDFIETIPDFFPINSVSFFVSVNKTINTQLDAKLFLDSVEVNQTKIMPKKGKSQELVVKIFSEEKPEIVFLNKTIDVSKSDNYYLAKIGLSNSLSPGNYSINVNTKNQERKLYFEYGSLSSFEVDTKRLYFEVEPGKEIIARFKLKNTGNIDLDLDLVGTDLVSENDFISIENFQIIQPQEKSMKKDTKEKISVGKEKTVDFLVKIFVPENIKPGTYNGLLNFEVEE